MISAGDIQQWQRALRWGARHRLQLLHWHLGHPDPPAPVRLPGDLSLASRQHQWVLNTTGPHHQCMSLTLRMCPLWIISEYNNIINKNSSLKVSLLCYINVSCDQDNDFFSNGAAWKCLKYIISCLSQNCVGPNDSWYSTFLSHHLNVVVIQTAIKTSYFVFIVKLRAKRET